jgi:hypothetical protein
MARSVDSMSFAEFEADLRLSVYSDREIASWIRKHVPLSTEQELLLVEAIEFAKGDRSPSPILKDALNVLRQPPAEA